MNWRRRSLVFALAVSVLLVAAAVAFAGPGVAVFDSQHAEHQHAEHQHAEYTTAFSDPFFQTDDAEADDILLEADVDENGDAVWTVEYRFLLADEESESAFDELEANIEEDETPYVDRFRERMESTVATAEESTDREMRVSDVRVDTYRQTLARDYGVVTYSFAWSGFAAVEEDTILVGDAVSGLFIDSDSRFVIAWADGYEATEIRPDPTRSTATSATWNGPFDFTTDEPRITLATVPPEESTPTEPGTEPTDPADPSEAPISSAVVAGIVALIVVIGAFLYLRRRSGDSAAGSSEHDDEGDLSETTSGSTPASSPTADSGSPDEPDPETDDGPPEELLSPEERVLKLVQEHGGRMKQQEVVSEMEWTDARTSQVVGSLREQGKLESFRLGRENVLKLPDEDDQDEENSSER